MLPDRERLELIGHGARAAEATQAYLGYFWQLDVGMRVTRRQVGLQVYHRDHLYERATLGKNELYVDWAVRHRALDIAGMAFDLVPGESFACLHVCHDREHGPDDAESSGAFGARGLTLLRLLYPAFKAGVSTHRSLALTELGSRRRWMTSGGTRECAMEKAECCTRLSAFQTLLRIRRGSVSR